VAGGEDTLVPCDGEVELIVGSGLNGKSFSPQRAQGNTEESRGGWGSSLRGIAK